MDTLSSPSSPADIVTRGRTLEGVGMAASFHWKRNPVTRPQDCGVGSSRVELVLPLPSDTARCWVVLRFWAPLFLTAYVVGLKLTQVGTISLYYCFVLYRPVPSGLVYFGGLQRGGVSSQTSCGWEEVPGGGRRSALAWPTGSSWPPASRPSSPHQCRSKEPHRTPAGFSVPAGFPLKEQWVTLRPERDSIMSQLQIHILKP